MIFRIKNCVVSFNELQKLVREKQFLTYANVNSFRINTDLNIKFKYTADGWPVAAYLSFIKRKKIPKLTCFRIENFWRAQTHEKKAIVIGYEEELLPEIIVQATKHDWKFEKVYNGYYDHDQYIDILRREVFQNNVELVFLGTGQPNQELLMNRLAFLEGYCSIVACGAFIIQSLKLDTPLSLKADKFGLTPLLRFKTRPLTLFKRTFLSLPFLFTSLK